MQEYIQIERLKFEGLADRKSKEFINTDTQFKGHEWIVIFTAPNELCNGPSLGIISNKPQTQLSQTTARSI